jgi:hypothetical protein
MILTDTISLKASLAFGKVEPAKRTRSWNRSRGALVKKLDLVTNKEVQQCF